MSCSFKKIGADGIGLGVILVYKCGPAGRERDGLEEYGEDS